MAQIKYYADIQLLGNQLKNVRAELLSEHPTLVEGRYYYNTTDKKLYYCNGIAWVSGGGILSVTAASNKVSVTNTDGAITIGIVEENINHNALANSGSVAHERIDDHILGTNNSGINLTPSNPHETSIADVLTVNTDAGDRKITGLADATAPTDAVNLQTLQSLIALGIIWQNPVTDIVDTLPVGHATGDRFILSTDNKIYTSNGTTFDTGTTPLDSWAVSVITDTSAPTNAVGKYVFNGTDWVNIQTVLERHDQLDNVLGGDWHLTQAEKEILTGTNGVANADTLHKHAQQSRNGLTINANHNELGGTLIKNTVIDADGFNFEVRRAGSIILETVVADQKTSLNIAPSGLGLGTENTLNHTRSYVDFNTTDAALINETGGVETKISVKDSEAVISSDATGFAGIKYAANYAANFTSLSLVHKAYVDGAIQGAIAAVAVTSGNGLTTTNTGIIELGGTVTKDTTISVTDTKTLSIGGAGAKNLKQSDAFGTNTIGVDSAGITIESRNDQNEQTFTFKTIDGAGFIGSELADFVGIRYVDDYSANFVARSLVDKGYVDTTIESRQANFKQEIIANTPYVFTNPFNNPNVIMSVVDVADGASVGVVETILQNQITIESNVTFTARITVIGMMVAVVNTSEFSNDEFDSDEFYT